MKRIGGRTLVSSFNNPFLDFNANTMQTSKILDYWCSPFNVIQSLPISEKEVMDQGTPLVFMGGRGSGKTMFLKYYSYDVQRDEAIRSIDTSSVIKHLHKKGGIGVYIRIDSPMLKEFTGYGVEYSKWINIFTHFFELTVCKEYMRIINDLIEIREIDKKTVESNVVPKIAKLLWEDARDIDSLDRITEKIINELEIVKKFRGLIPFSNQEFCPSKVFLSKQLSFGVPRILKETIPEFVSDDFKFVVFIDEYENFSAEQQKIVNTLMKFVEEGITIRIGMRMEGFRTYDTISETEFIKENDDYYSINLDQFLSRGSEYRNYLSEIAAKRLQSEPLFRNFGHTDINFYLSDKEDIVDEARNLVGDEKRHFKIFEKFSPQFTPDVLKLLENNDNPLLEMQNLLWLIRENEPSAIKETMENYLLSKSSPLTKKYKRDFIQKYKLSYMILLSSIYRRQKKYYSFNTFTHLSSGIPRRFIELCKISFRYASFEDPDDFHKKPIPMDLQTKAAYEVARSELNNINRISKHGSSLYKFTMNLGNVFKKYHQDVMLRYPEVNQISIDINSIIDEEVKDAMKSAIEWSIIQKKPILQSTGPGLEKAEIFTLNKIFSPLFNLTYRTRGQFSEKIMVDDLSNYLYTNTINPNQSLDLKYKGRIVFSSEDGKKQSRLIEYDH